MMQMGINREEGPCVSRMESKAKTWGWVVQPTSAFSMLGMTLYLLSSRDFQGSPSRELSLE